MGGPESLDFTVLGDAPNPAARLGSAATGGQLILSESAAASAGTATDGLERRDLMVKGKSEPLPGWVEAF